MTADPDACASTDPLLARWPRPALEAVSWTAEARTRDAATARALEAYLSASRELPVHRVIRL